MDIVVTNKASYLIIFCLIFLAVLIGVNAKVDLSQGYHTLQQLVDSDGARVDDDADGIVDEVDFTQKVLYNHITGFPDRCVQINGRDSFVTSISPPPNRLSCSTLSFGCSWSISPCNDSSTCFDFIAKEDLGSKVCIVHPFGYCFVWRIIHDLEPVVCAVDSVDLTIPQQALSLSTDYFNPDYAAFDSTGNLWVSSEMIEEGQTSASSGYMIELDCLENVCKSVPLSLRKFSAAPKQIATSGTDIFFGAINQGYLYKLGSSCTFENFGLNQEMRGVAVSGSNVFVSNTNGNKIIKYDSNLVYQKEVIAPSPQFMDTGIFDGTNFLFVASSTNTKNNILVYDLDLNLKKTLSTEISTEYTIKGLDYYNDYLFVSGETDGNPRSFILKRFLLQGSLTSLSLSSLSTQIYMGTDILGKPSISNGKLVIPINKAIKIFDYPLSLTSLASPSASISEVKIDDNTIVTDCGS